MSFVNQIRSIQKSLSKMSVTSDESSKEAANVQSQETKERRQSLRKIIRPNYRDLEETLSEHFGGDESTGEKQKKPKKNATIEDYYLDRTVKRIPATLETIFEEPVMNESNQLVYMSKKKLKRSITVPKILNKVPPTKQKNRKKKAKLLLGKKQLKKIPKSYLMEVLDKIEQPDGSCEDVMSLQED